MTVTSARRLIYTRIYSGAGGHSYFEDVYLQGDAVGIVESDLRAVFSEKFPTEEMSFRDVVVEADDEQRHNAPRCKFLIVLKGRCVVETSLGDTRELGAGDALLAEDTTGFGHTTRRLGDEQRLTLEVTLTGR